MRPDKTKKRLIGVHMPIELIKRLKLEAARRDSSVQRVMIDLFDKVLPHLDQELRHLSDPPRTARKVANG
jgi:hypothetical protein